MRLTSSFSSIADADDVPIKLEDIDMDDPIMEAPLKDAALPLYPVENDGFAEDEAMKPNSRTLSAFSARRKIAGR